MGNYSTLKKGSSGESVRELQEKLNSYGNYGLQTDGVFGDKTLAAVQDYQKKNSLAVDGIVGTNTWGALNNASSGSTAAQAPAPAPTPAQPTAPTFEYKKSDAVAQAEALLQQQLANKPGEYQSAWQTQLNDTIQKILNREKFSYDLNGDMLYQQYKDQFTTQGKLASMDVMGQAAAMTGGYGNSYAQTAGQQAYQGYLQQLNDKIPELYQLALNQYNQEGQSMYDQASLMAGMEEQDYGRYRDQVSDYYTELNRLTDDARYMSETEYNQALQDFNIKYGSYRDTVGDQQWQAQFDEAKRQYDEQMALSQSKSAGGTTSSNKTGDKGGNDYTKKPDGWDKEKIKAFQAAHGLTVDGIWGPKTAAEYDKDSDWEPEVVVNYDTIVADLNTFIKNGANKSEIGNYLRAEYKAGTITQAEYNKLKDLYMPRGNTY